MPHANVLGWQFTQLENNIKTVESIIAMSDPQALTTYRDGGTGWTVLEVVCHLRDFEAVYGERMHLAVDQDNPLLPFPNPDDMARERRYGEQTVGDALAEWKARRAGLLAFLRARSESDWERPAQHPTRGTLTLHDQLTLETLHDTIHLEQMTRILNEKRLS